MCMLFWAATGYGIVTAFLPDEGAYSLASSPPALMAPMLIAAIGWAVIAMRRTPSARIDAAAIEAPMPSSSLSA